MRLLKNVDSSRDWGIHDGPCPLDEEMKLEPQAIRDALAEQRREMEDQLIRAQNELSKAMHRMQIARRAYENFLGLRT